MRGAVKIRLCFPANDGFSVFETDYQNRFTYTDCQNNTKILIDNVTDVFDGVCDYNGFYHFAIQTLDGSLIYLRFDGEQWIKYRIFESKNKIASIDKIYLCAGKNLLCAFYIMKHDDRFLLVKHCFCSETVHLMPVVIDRTDQRRDFCICSDSEQTIIFYRNELGIREEKCFDGNFNPIKHEYKFGGNDIYRLCAVKPASEIYVAYIKQKNNITALYFCNYSKPDTSKIITFGIAKNSEVYMIAYDNVIKIIWQENGMLMQSESSDGGKSFSRPALSGEKNNLTKMKVNNRMFTALSGDFLTLKNSEKFMNHLKNNFKKKDEYMKMNSEANHTNPFKNFDITTDFHRKLTDIQNEVEKIGIHLEQVCTFLDKLTDFKKETVTNPQTSFDGSEIINQEKKEHLSGEDVGEIHEENVAIFENMTIDE